MTGFVSNPDRSEDAATLAAPMSIVALVFILQGYPWAGLAWLGLAFAWLLVPMAAAPARLGVRRHARNPVQS